MTTSDLDHERRIWSPVPSAPQSSSSVTTASPGRNDPSLMSTADADATDNKEDPASADVERHPKGKRKRTAAKDKIILEEAYRSNTKPDKAARFDIVSRVSLNEKEVQIWFQNRRQNDRRKSRPLSPQEIAALRSGSMQILSADASVYQSYATMNANANANAGPVPPIPGPLLSPLPRADLSTTCRESAPSSDDGETMRSDSSRNASSSDEGFRTTEGGGGGGSGSGSGDDDDPARRLSSSSWSNGVGYLSNRRNLGSSFSSLPSTLSPGDGSFITSHSPSPTASAAPSLANLSSSKFRLSLSIEGKAELVPTTQTSPPDRQVDPVQPQPQHQPRTSILQRSASLSLPQTPGSVIANRAVTLPPISTLTGSLPSSAPTQQRHSSSLHRGRSRDAHAWELCCDTDVRDELTAHAENEASGSALAPISLLRSTSSGGAGIVLQPSSAGKRNATLGKASLQNHHHLHHSQQQQQRATTSGVKRPRLGRWPSTAGKFQSRPGDKAAARQSAVVEKKEGDDDVAKIKVSMLLSPSGDSDKENCKPDEGGNRIEQPRPRRPPPSASSLLHERGVVAPASRPRSLTPLTSPKTKTRPTNCLGHALGCSTHPLLLRANTASPSRKSPTKRLASRLDIWEDSTAGGEHGDNDSGETGESPRKRRARDGETERFMRGEVHVSPSKRPDMDCVAGLLSLSQGNWK